MRGKCVILWQLLLLMPLMGLGVGCGNDSTPLGPATGSPPVQGVPLTSIDSFPSGQRAAAEAVATAIASGGEEPREFYAEIETEDGLLVFHLWHETAFLPENRGMMGNPGGLCRDVRVEPVSVEVVAMLWWQ